jgi:hypothetical protein
VFNAIPKKQVQHEPMTATHTHLHAGNGAADEQDGMHMHEHAHQQDALHIGHAHTHLGPGTPGKESGPGMRSGDGIYGAMLDPSTGPLGRHLARQQMDEIHDSHRGM